jgi:cytochrome oxidase assembly protein ShyY1
VSWRFVLTPKWIVRHMAVVLLVATMLAAGIWQLRRLADKQDHNAVLEARERVPVQPVEDVIPRDADLDSDEVDTVLYRTVEAVGTYDADETVVVENRTNDGRPGAWVLTPLRLGDGLSVVINRGFVGFTVEGAIEPPAPPEGTVRVRGIVLASQQRGSFGAADRRDVELDVLARVDLERLGVQVEDDLLPAYVQLASSAPGEPTPVDPQQPRLETLDPPDQSEGPHLGYAVQWFIFTTIATGGYGLLLRKVARDQARPAPGVTEVSGRADG